MIRPAKEGDIAASGNGDRDILKKRQRLRTAAAVNAGSVCRTANRRIPSRRSAALLVETAPVEFVAYAELFIYKICVTFASTYETTAAVARCNVDRGNNSLYLIENWEAPVRESIFNRYNCCRPELLSYLGHTGRTDLGAVRFRLKGDSQYRL